MGRQDIYSTCAPSSNLGPPHCNIPLLRMDTDQDQSQIMAPCKGSLWTTCFLLLALPINSTTNDTTNSNTIILRPILPPLLGTWTLDCNVTLDTPLSNGRPHPKDPNWTCRKYWTCAEDDVGQMSLTRHETTESQKANYDAGGRPAWCRTLCECVFRPPNAKPHSLPGISFLFVDGTYPVHPS